MDERFIVEDGVALIESRNEGEWLQSDAVVSLEDWA